MTTKNDKKKPVWLEKRWEKRKEETVTRVRNAIQALVKEKRSVSIRLICDKVREQTGHSLSPNTIKHNFAAYELYRQHASYKQTSRIKDPAFRQMINECSEAKRSALQAKIYRLKQLAKDDLIARLIELEREINESKRVENKLRERLIELEIFVHKSKRN